MRAKYDEQKSEDRLSKNDSVENRIARSFEWVATTTERVGIPAATFAIGALVIGLNAKGELPDPETLWLGASLVLASLGTYIWLTARSTIKVQLPPPPIPTEIQLQLDWMRQQLTEQNGWLRTQLQRTLSDASEKSSL